MRSSFPLSRAYNGTGPSPSTGFNGGYTGPFLTPDKLVQRLVVKPQLPDGFVMAGFNGLYTEESMVFIPFSTAQPGTYMSVRVIYWNHFGYDMDFAIWIGVPLVEVLCIVSNTAGVDGFMLSSNERVCDTITLTNGYLGFDGAIYSFGTPGPAGTTVNDYPAMVKLDIQGPKLLSFDFQATDPNGAVLTDVPMNALYAKQSQMD